MSGGHEVELAGCDQLVAAEAVAVFDHALDQPGDRLQAGVRVWGHLHARAAADVVGPEVVDEAPGTDHPSLLVRQQPTDGGVPAERYVVAGEQHAVGFGHLGQGALV